MLQFNSNLVPTQKNPTLSFFSSRKPQLNPPWSARCRKAHALKCRQSEYYDDHQQQQQQRVADSGEPSFSSPGGGHSIYKGKAAMTVEPRAPEFYPFDGPFKGRSDEGKIRKILKIEPLPDGSGHFFNLSVQKKLLNLDESIYMPITKAEFTVLVSAFNFLLLYLIGWNAFALTTMPAQDMEGTMNETHDRQRQRFLADCF